MPEMIAALDGGGTKTALALADRRGNCHFLQGLGGCNPQDNPDWAAVLAAALGQITDRCHHPKHVVLGLSGFGEVPDHDAAMQAAVAANLPGPVTVLNDVALAYHGAFAGTDGVLILAGTGSMAMAKGPVGLVRVGGWGDLIGDEGSAFWIGQRALRSVARALDGRGAEADFAQALLAAMTLDPVADPFAPLNWLMSKAHPRSAVAGIARVVDRLAEQGDPVARAILTRAAGHLIWQAHAAANKAGLPVGFDWCRAGSVFRSRTVEDAVAKGLGQPARVHRLDALGGGLWLAATAAGWRPDRGWTHRIGAATRAWSA